jgi:hypothetical protein
MMLETTAPTLSAFGTLPIPGVSETARFVGDQAEDDYGRLRSSYAPGIGSRRILEELWAVAESAKQPDWDGYGAELVTDEAYRRAYRFAESFPFGTPAPSVSAEPDGQLAFEWHVTPYRTLSVSVSPDGDLHYSALLGPNKAYGTEVFFGEMPRAILDLIRRVYAA